MNTRALVCSWLAAAVVTFACASPSAAGQDQLAAAKDLYASAAYEDALSALSAARDREAADVPQIDQYRVFCLFALGRTTEAESIAEALVRTDPLLTLDARDASPRIESMFTQVKKRLLPGLVRDRYRLARAALDQGQTASAADQFTRVRQMLDAAKSLDARDEGLGDLSLLVDGFLDLARASSRPPAAEAPSPAAAAAQPGPSAPVQLRAEAPSQEVPPVTRPSPAPKTSSRSTEATQVAKPPQASKSTPAPKPLQAPKPSQAPKSAQAYSGVDTDVKPPVTIRQEMPRVPGPILSTMRNANKTGGILEVVIAEDGSVTEAVMRDPVNATFDSLMIAAARSWRYQPATKAGQPVPYVKRIAVSVSPGATP
jgi:protein TonB